MKTEDIFSVIERQESEMIQALIGLIRIPAIAPENGGEGESEKAGRLIQILNAEDFDEIAYYDVEDERVPSGKRPNIIAYYEGERTDKKLWIVTHLDVVPSGDESSWTITEPFNPIVREDRIYGRGSEDNGQSMVASIFAVKALKKLEVKPKRTIALAFVADEEQGSTYGIQHLIKEKLFEKEDLIVVPDSGKKDGSFIEIAEKSGLWFRVRTIGKQTHASRPDKGLNAHRLGMEYTLSLDSLLHQKYSLEDRQFDLPKSTFEPTMKDKNVDAINIIPGEDLAYFDCRILPHYNLEEMLKNIREHAKDFGTKKKVEVKIEVLRKSKASKPTDPNSEVVIKLKEAIGKVYEIRPEVGGIGGGTCAAFFRREGIPAVVWSTIDGTAHQPNEYSKIVNLVNDAKVFASLAFL
ncbi:MAG: M20 family metallo-hydrolase [Candidatus Bathyarchaeota archaeon]|jgi:succinyl-diaminopimelate desuccinylase